MPICWNIEADRRRTVVTVADPYTFQQWEDALAEMMAAQACKWRTFLIDRRKSTPPTPEFVRMMSYSLAVRADRIDQTRVAVVVSGDVGFGMGRMAQMTAEANNPAISMRVFRAYDEAERWLGAATPNA
jgi:hypothetical protein